LGLRESFGASSSVSFFAFSFFPESFRTCAKSSPEAAFKGFPTLLATGLRIFSPSLPSSSSYWPGAGTSRMLDIAGAGLKKISWEPAGFLFSACFQPETGASFDGAFKRYLPSSESLSLQPRMPPTPPLLPRLRLRTISRSTSPAILPEK